MQQKPIDILHVIAIAVGFMREARPELFTENHPLVTLFRSLEDTHLGDRVEKQIFEQSIEDTLMMLYNVLNTTVKQLQTFH